MSDTDQLLPCDTVVFNLNSHDETEIVVDLRDESVEVTNTVDGYLDTIDLSRSGEYVISYSAREEIRPEDVDVIARAAELANVYVPELDTAQHKRERRLEALRALCDHYMLEVRIDGPWHTTAMEDIVPYFTGEEEIARFAAVTEHDDITYIYPEYSTRGEASERTVEYVNDTLFSESPIAVVDLDSPAGPAIFPLDKVIPLFSSRPQHLEISESEKGES